MDTMFVYSYLGLHARVWNVRGVVNSQLQSTLNITVYKCSNGHVVTQYEKYGSFLTLHLHSRVHGSNERIRHYVCVPDPRVSSPKCRFEKLNTIVTKFIVVSCILEIPLYYISLATTKREQGNKTVMDCTRWLKFKSFFSSGIVCLNNIISCCKYS